MRIFKETKQKHLYFSAAFALSLALAPTGVYANDKAKAAEKYRCFCFVSLKILIRSRF